MHLIDTLAPIIIVIAIGVVLRARGFISAELTRGLNKLTFWVGMPALLFVKIATAEFAPGPPLRVAGVTIAAMLVVAVLTDVVQRVLKTPSPVRGAVSQASFRSNCVYIGLVVILYALEASPALGLAERTATLALGGIIPFLAISSVVVLIQHEEGASPVAAVRKTVVSAVTNPFVIACALATPFSLFDWPLPGFFTRSCDALGRMALPLALLGIGASLQLEPVKRHAVRASVVTLLKLALLPAVAYGVARSFALGPVELFIVMVFCACPTAVTAYVMAEQMDADAELSAASIVLSTAASVVSLSLMLWWFTPAF
ncbi:MAG: AEC family transporter [Planctomycetota bacterium]|nr:AEC family transporter [Planctomycetota bacterium]